MVPARRHRDRVKAHLTLQEGLNRDVTGRTVVETAIQLWRYKILTCSPVVLKCARTLNLFCSERNFDRPGAG